MQDDALVGTTIGGKYQLTALLGRGAFGVVYEGLNVELEKRVAVKLIEPEYVKHEEVVARFRVEARAASRVESEHIVQVFDVGTDEQHGLFMVMELLHGEDLAARLDREFKLSPAVAVHIAVQAARGLAKAHAAGVVHRDLKPANIFLVSREDGSLLVKLVDFGISKLLGHDATRGLTRMGTTVGTPNYMAPEQARGLDVDGRADIWALGAVLYEMLAGAPAYAHDLTYEQTIIAIATGPEPNLRDVAPWVPAPLADVVQRALTRDLAQRIPDGATFAALLTEAMPAAARPRREESLYMEPSEEAPPAPHVPDDVAAAAQPMAPRGAPATVITSRAKPKRGGRWLWITVPLLLLSAAIVVAWRTGAYQRYLSPEPPPATPASVEPPPSASTATPAVTTKASAVKPKPLKPKATTKPAPSHS